MSGEHVPALFRERPLFEAQSLLTFTFCERGRAPLLPWLRIPDRSPHCGSCSPIGRQ
jgi:hypothetical protein